MLKAAAVTGLPVEATNTDAQVSAAVSASHTRSHPITSASDHTSSAAAGQLLKADANGLPVNATNTDAQVASAVTNSHSKLVETRQATAIDVTAGTAIIILAVTNVAGGRTIALPASQATTGRFYIVIDESGTCSPTDYIDVVGQSGKTINGAASYRIQAPYDAVKFESNGTNWFTVHRPRYHTHDGTDAAPKLAQANTHESADTDSAPTALHHTLGTGANQAAAGDHTHGTGALAFSRQSTAISANASETATVVGVTNTAAARTITLLTAQCTDGRYYHIKDESLAASNANYIEIVGQGGELIDGQASQRITSAGGCISVYSNGAAWFIF